MLVIYTISGQPKCTNDTSPMQYSITEVLQPRDGYTSVLPLMTESFQNRIVLIKSI